MEHVIVDRRDPGRILLPAPPGAQPVAAHHRGGEAQLLAGDQHHQPHKLIPVGGG
jgi:hypothetical protein